VYRTTGITLAHGVELTVGLRRAVECPRVCPHSRPRFSGTPPLREHAAKLSGPTDTSVALAAMMVVDVKCQRSTRSARDLSQLAVHVGRAPRQRYWRRIKTTLRAGNPSHESRMHCGVGEMRVSCHDMAAEQAEAPGRVPQEVLIEPGELAASRQLRCRRWCGSHSPPPAAAAPSLFFGPLPVGPGVRDVLVTSQAHATTVERLPYSEAMGVRGTIASQYPCSPRRCSPQLVVSTSGTDRKRPDRTGAKVAGHAGCWRVMPGERAAKTKSGVQADSPPPTPLACVNARSAQCLRVKGGHRP
jgi:hypothetical protein